jgi:hypothetical protein
MIRETLPYLLEKALTDEYNYLVGLRSGAVFQCTHASEAARTDGSSDWIHLHNVEYISGIPNFNKAFFGERGMNVRISEISFIMDATS